MPYCKGRKKDGMPCGAKMVMETGYCARHDPELVKEKDYLKQKEELLVDRERELELRGEMINRSLAQSEIIEAIGQVQDIESLKTAELAIIQGLVEGTIDPKAGGPVASLLKHHADLLTKDKPAGGLREEERKALIEMSLKLSLTDAWALMQDMAGGMKTLLQKSKDEATITITAENQDGTENAHCIGITRDAEATGSETTILSAAVSIPAEVQDGDLEDS